MAVLCCGSHLDGITPVEFLQKLGERIGTNCDSKLDFDGGHAFAAADATAMPYINGWLRRKSTPLRKVWKVVGGADKGGIVVRRGPGPSAQQEEERLASGTVVEQLEISGDRLHYKLLEGNGPEEGWVLLRLKSGADLLVPVTV
eukprot:TRINITY_DN80188_c0_g1_i1.p1 TRINITY_DN80188_c0_g1~~TRINITY_DN80188_c0_g1_i1.p1  ORF type:complete len:166 (+),score=38.24 TRINITY_DN80188_c0_g1_i1:69-500(+)